MSEKIVNLRLARKAKARSEAGKKAEENRAKFGQTKAEKTARKAEESRAARQHAGGKLESSTKSGSDRPDGQG